MEKLDAWAEDRRTALKSEVDDLDQVLREAKKAARLAANLPEKLSRQREARVIEGKRDEAFRAFDQACRDIDRKKDELLDEIGRRLEQTSGSEVLFTLRFHVV
jgi:F0F1-type ATP synthase membrane subunit b/b'